MKWALGAWSKKNSNIGKRERNKDGHVAEVVAGAVVQKPARKQLKFQCVTDVLTNELRAWKREEKVNQSPTGNNGSAVPLLCQSTLQWRFWSGQGTAWHSCRIQGESVHTFICLLGTWRDRWTNGQTLSPLEPLPKKRVTNQSNIHDLHPHWLQCRKL